MLTVSRSRNHIPNQKRSIQENIVRPLVWAIIGRRHRRKEGGGRQAEPATDLSQIHVRVPFFVNKINRINAKIGVAVHIDHIAYTTDPPFSISNPCRCLNIPLPPIAVSDHSEDSEPLEFPSSLGGEGRGWGSDSEGMGEPGYEPDDRSSRRGHLGHNGTVM